jgi:excisionase family DNA binding protein
MQKIKIINQKRLLTVKNLAYKLNISERTIYNKLSNGTFPIKPLRVGKRLLRWRTGDVEQYLNSL